MRVPGRCLVPITVILLMLLPSAAGADEISPAQPAAPAHTSSGLPFLEIGRWILIVLAFLAIFGALVVKHRAVRAALRDDAPDHAPGQSNA